MRNGAFTDFIDINVTGSFNLEVRKICESGY